MQQDFSLPADRKKCVHPPRGAIMRCLKFIEKNCVGSGVRRTKKKKKMNKKRNQRRKEWQEALFCHYAWASQRMAFFFLFVILFNTKYAFFLLIMLKGSSNRSSNITQETLATHRTTKHCSPALLKKLSLPFWLHLIRFDEGAVHSTVHTIYSFTMSETA